MSSLLDERRESLRDRMSSLNSALTNKMLKRDRAEADGDDATAQELTLEIARILHMQASTSEHVADLSRETMVLFFEREEREARTRRSGERPAEGRIELPEEAVPDALRSASATVDEIVTELRLKRNWSYQRVVDFLVVSGKTKKNGKANWHTSDVYAICKRLIRRA
jgi:hypothetical protein